MAFPTVKLTKGIHVMHLFYHINRVRWSQLPADSSSQTRSRLEAFCENNSSASNPRIMTYANIGAKADLAFVLFAAELGQIGRMHRDLEACFRPGTLVRA